MSWYALYCKPGQEEIIIKSCKQHLTKAALDDAFQLSYERMKKYLGEWHVDTYSMFPRYIFLQSQCPEILSEELKQYRDFVEVLENEHILLKVQPEEEEALKLLCGENHHMGMSRGVMTDRVLKVTEGPLRGRESLIRKVDRHKRVAMLNLRVAKDMQDVWAGLEVTAK